VEESESDCLHCEINEVVQGHMERLETVELPELVSQVGESLVDLILLGPKEQWGNLLAETISDVGHLFLEKGGAIGGGTSH
jgi:hypothetical protein